MNEKMIPVITVDGPSGVGKGTISQMLARHLGWHFLDSGALYRITALAAVSHGVDLAQAASVARLAAALDVEFVVSNRGEPVILLEKQDVTSGIRTEQCGNDASRVAALPEVRQALLQRQRDFRAAPGLVADGRDMGTTVFPDAQTKIFLTASAEVRALRRYNQLKEKGLSVSLGTLSEEIADRDRRDSSRSSSPLRPAADAVIIDTSELTVQEVFDRVIKVYSERVGLTP